MTTGETPIPGTSQSAEITSHAAEPDAAERHFAAKLRYETDCWDTNEALRSGADDVVVLDVRSTAAYDAGHVPGSHSLPWREITSERLDSLSPDALFVVYCAGPHCNGADKAALRIARLGRRVKIMIGGHHGWQVEGLPLET
ncbi:MAG: rhodanese-like domain-containing protein [Acidimicrobiia bacterium]|nr:rhodanese-like domain-containing protein [Acidimicrobiia bacterium]